MKKLFFALFVTVVIFVVVICVKDKPVVPIEEHNETKTRKDEYQATLEYIMFLHRSLGKLEGVIAYDPRTI